MKETILIEIVGDICPAWGFRSAFDHQDADAVFGELAPILRKGDLTLGNLEAPLSDRGATLAKCGPCLRGKPKDMEVLKAAGFDGLTMANNHILDFGETALFDTMSAARTNGIRCFGAGKNREEAKKATFFQVKGWRIGALGFGEEEFNCAYENAAGANLFDPYESLEEIAAAKAQCDYLIVFYHGGIEHYAYPSPLLQKKCRKMAQAGADLVLCQHSHCIGTRECFAGSEILYGQGNGVFGRIEGREAWNTGLLTTVRLSAEEKSVSYRLIEAGETGILLPNEERNSARLKLFEEQSALLSDPAALKEQWIAFCKKNEAEYLPMLFSWGRVANKLNRMLGNRLIRLCAPRKKQRVSMNLIRCDAHREVCQTLLENNVYGD